MGRESQASPAVSHSAEMTGQIRAQILSMFIDMGMLPCCMITSCARRWALPMILRPPTATS